MKGYKAFNKGLVCLGKQYAENTVFEEDEAVICKKGMHFCKEPLYVLDYYPVVDENGELNEFAEVEALDDPITDDGKKFCTKQLKIGAKIDFPHLVKASVSFDYEKETPIKTTKKNNAKIGSSGDGAKIGSSGDGAQIGSSGKNAVIMCAGNNSIAKGKIGSWITLSEWEDVDGVYTPVCVKTERIDGERIKEDTFYTLKDGKFFEVK